MEFLNTISQFIINHTDDKSKLYTLLALIPLAILYFIRPRPKDRTLPSLMFIIKMSGKSRPFFSLRRFVTDFLFLIHFLIIALLAFAVAQPFVMVKHNLASDNNIIIIDASASMQAAYGSTTRFEKAKEMAAGYIAKKNTIILAENKPAILLDGGDEGDATKALASLSPKATTTNLGDALNAAGELMKGKGRVVVFSDFISNVGPDVFNVKKVLESKGILVDFVDLMQKADNIGFVNLAFGEEESVAYVKNYKDTATIVKVSINNVIVEKNIPSRSIETIKFAPAQGITKLTLEPADDFMLDNVAVVSRPQIKPVRALLITNNDHSFIESALRSLDFIQLEVTNPPVMPAKLDHDIIILSDTDPPLVIAGTFESIEKAVDKGSSFVIMASPELPKLKAEKLLPVTLLELRNKTAITPTTENSITKGIPFGNAAVYFGTETLAGSAVLLSASDNSSLFTIKKFGDGKVIYYGIVDNDSDFKLSPYYPIFWSRTVKFLEGIEDASSFNQKTGNLVALREKQEVKTPSTTIKTSLVIFDEAGTYTIADKQVAVNLFDEKESEVTREEELQIPPPASQEKSIFDKKQELMLYFVIAAMVLLIFDMLYMKWRGEI